MFKGKTASQPVAFHANFSTKLSCLPCSGTNGQQISKLFVFFFCIPSYISGVHHFWWVLCMWPFWVLQSIQVGSYILSSWKVHAGCVFVAGIHPSRTRMSGSFEFVRWECVCAQTSPVLILSSERVFWNGVRNQVNTKGKILCTRGPGEGQTRDPASHRTASPTLYQLSCSGP